MDYHMDYPMINVMYLPPPPSHGQNDRQTPGKHYLPATSFAGSKTIPVDVNGVAFDLTDGKTEAAAGDFFLFPGDTFFFGEPFFVANSKILNLCIHTIMFLNFWQFLRVIK